MKFLIFGIISGFLGFVVSPQYRFSGDVYTDFNEVGFKSIVIGLCLWLASQVNGHNHIMLVRSRIDFTVNVLVASCIGCFGAFLFFYILDYNLVGRWVLLGVLLSYNVLIISNNYWVILNGEFKVFIIGEEVDHLKGLVGAIGLKNIADEYTYIECLFQKDSIGEVLSEIPRNCVYYLLPGRGCEKISEIYSKLDSQILSRITCPKIVAEQEFGVVLFEECDSINWWDISANIRNPGFIFTKRFLDLILGLMLILISLPLMLVVSAFVKFSDGGPVFYRQVRLGQYGKPFLIFKFRTMRVDSEMGGAQWAKVSDSRATKIGNILRRTRVDELPQLWNILCGDMSLIGPRPERPEFYKYLEDSIKQFKVRLICKPGLTGWAQVNYPYGASVHDSKVKMFYDLYYIKNASIYFDIRILTRTVIAMVKGAR